MSFVKMVIKIQEADWFKEYLKVRKEESPGT